ncbi:hypothetical protein [Actinocorallia longicatena]|uniref:Hemolysin type calcium-binding protein n=1 Tax=Actinocorallia longicatena TaxID=111803 RepID=A0ABP6Q9N9_9ACTN
MASNALPARSSARRPVRRAALLASAAALVAVPLAVAGATPALATTGVSISSGGQLNVSAGDVDNNILIYVEGSSIVVKNFSDVLTANSGCTKGADGGVRCASAGLTKIQISTGDGVDSVVNSTALPSKVFLNRGGDYFLGGSARDTVFGDEDDDTIEGNGGSDVIVGGPGDLDRAFGGGGFDYCSAETRNSCEGDA